jgi:glycosyltransferase involved in cell wall biosynthesis
MIIGLDIREWERGRQTGIGRFLEEFLRVALAVRPRDRFLLLGNGATELRVSGENLAFQRHPEPWTPWWDQVTLPRVLRREAADVLFSPYIKAPLLGRAPVVNTIHDLTFFIRADYNRRRRDVLLNLPFRLLCHAVVKRTAAILVDSAASARDVQRYLRAKPEKLRVIPLATSPAFHPESDPAADSVVRDRYGLTPGYVLYVGSFWPHKNVPLVIRAHAALPESLRGRHPLMLAGGPATSPATSLLSDPIIAAAARFLGPIPEADLPALYRSAALFVFPSHYEGFGLPVLEAMACGTPVLCSTTPALVELTVDSAEHADPEAGTSWEQALHALLEDPERRAMLAARGRARAALFTRERMAQSILDVLDEAAERSP